MAAVRVAFTKNAMDAPPLWRCMRLHLASPLPLWENNRASRLYSMARHQAPRALLCSVKNCYTYTAGLRSCCRANLCRRSRSCIGGELARAVSTSGTPPYKTAPLLRTRAYCRYLPRVASHERLHLQVLPIAVSPVASLSFWRDARCAPAYAALSPRRHLTVGRSSLNGDALW